MKTLLEQGIDARKAGVFKRWFATLTSEQKTQLDTELKSLGTIVQETGISVSQGFLVAGEVFIIGLTEGIEKGMNDEGNTNTPAIN